MDDLRRLHALCVEHQLPREQNVFQEIEEYNETMRMLNHLGSSAIESVSLKGSNPDLECVRVTYGGYIFNIISF